MNQIKIGKFIATQRQKHGLTQKQLTDQLHLSPKTISKWENGRGIPDIEILKQISEVFRVDLETLLNGEEKKKPKKNYLFIYFGLAILIICVIIGIIILHNQKGFSFSDVVSSNESFSLKGVAAYSNDQSSIFLSDIVFLDEENTKEEYVSIACMLYEEDGNVERKIGESGELKSDEVQTLNSFLKQIEFHIDSFEISCNNLSESNLYLAIYAKTKEGKTETYIIPLELTSCTIHK